MTLRKHYRLNDNSNQGKSLGIIKDTFTGYFCARTIYHLWLAGYQWKLKVCTCVILMTA